MSSKLVGLREDNVVALCGPEGGRLTYYCRIRDNHRAKVLGGLVLFCILVVLRIEEVDKFSNMVELLHESVKSD
jgi:hypothetical protein